MGELRCRPAVDGACRRCEIRRGGRVVLCERSLAKLDGRSERRAWIGRRLSFGAHGTVGDVTVRVEHLAGRDRLDATTHVLQRARRVDPAGGVWEAADVQWWWRRSRLSDDVALPVWFDGDGPCAVVGVTDWATRCQLDAHVVPGTMDLELVWSAVMEAGATSNATLEVLARDDDAELRGLLTAEGFQATQERSGIMWMAAADRPVVAPLPDGFGVIDRLSRPLRRHPFTARNGTEVEDRLRQCSLYDPWLDLAVDTPNGEPAGYALFWFDDVTLVGMLEPMRVDDRYQRRGLARALLTAGLDRLVARGAQRLKVGFDSPAARHLYESAGFAVTSTLRSFRR